MPDYVRQEVISQQVRLYLARNRAAATQMTLAETPGTIQVQSWERSGNWWANPSSIQDDRPVE